MGTVGLKVANRVCHAHCWSAHHLFGAAQGPNTNTSECSCSNTPVFDVFVFYLCLDQLLAANMFAFGVFGAFGVLAHLFVFGTFWGIKALIMGTKV